jgi:hypothetical protein
LAGQLYRCEGEGEGGFIVGCTGASGSCDGLTGQACLTGGFIGCLVQPTEVVCQQRIFCIPALDGCPFDFCNNIAGNCTFKDSAFREQQQACSTLTSFGDCGAADCAISRVTDAVCTGDWSCDNVLINFDDPRNPPTAEICTDLQPLGFGCTPVFQ